MSIMTRRKWHKKRTQRVLHPPQTKQHEARQEPRRIVRRKRIVELSFEASSAFKAQSASIGKFPGNLLDVSSKGVGIFSVSQIPLGSKVRLTFCDEKHPYSLIGQVMWCAAIPSSNNVFKTEPSMKWRIGLMLIEGENQDDLNLYRENLDSF